jgi:TorA maturation chaperone TorD
MKSEPSTPLNVRLGYLLGAAGDWWTVPSLERIDLWSSRLYRSSIADLWRETLGATPDCVDALLSGTQDEGVRTIAEYERLFVGPAAPSCPPYEATWRSDPRGARGQGALCGSPVEEVLQIYDALGFRLNSARRELGDHIAVEFEGAACAFAMNAAPEAWRLVDHLRSWAPRLCSAVRSHSSATFFPALAETTEEMLSGLDIARLAMDATPQECSPVASPA